MGQIARLAGLEDLWASSDLDLQQLRVAINPRQRGRFLSYKIFVNEGIACGIKQDIHFSEYRQNVWKRIHWDSNGHLHHMPALGGEFQNSEISRSRWEGKQRDLFQRSIGWKTRILLTSRPNSSALEIHRKAHSNQPNTRDIALTPKGTALNIQACDKNTIH